MHASLRWYGVVSDSLQAVPSDAVGSCMLTISRIRHAITVLADLKPALPSPLRLSPGEFDASLHQGATVLTVSYRSAAQVCTFPIPPPALPQHTL